MQLKRVVDTLRPEYEDRVAFVTADLSTLEGQAFAATAGVGETTLLFFDRSGNPLNQQQGATTEANLRRLIDSTFQLRRSPAAAGGSQQRAKQGQRE
jgi:hypothetical protein